MSRKKAGRPRRVLRVLHLWLGVLLGLYTVVVGITGSALVFAPELEGIARPRSGPPSALPLAPIVERLSAEHPREHVLGIDNLDTVSAPAVVYLDAPNVDRVAGEQRMALFNQRSGAPLGSRLRYAGLLGTCANLHISLLSGPTGNMVNGVCACAFLALCLTGWMLWWPGRGRIGRALRIHWRARFQRLNWDLHTTGGFWSNPLLILVIATGILFVFPRPALVGLSCLTGGGVAAVDAWLAPPPAPHSGSPLRDADAALAEARILLRSDPGYSVRYLALPGPSNPVYEAIAYPRGAPEYALPIDLYLDAHTLAPLAVRDARTLPAGMRWATFAYALHFGTFGGFFSRVVWVALGLLPAVLWGTGLLLWWHRGLRTF